MLRSLVSPRGRAYLYRVAAALVLLLGGYGLIADELVPLWIGLGAAVFGVGTAVVNTSTKT